MRYVLSALLAFVLATPLAVAQFEVMFTDVAYADSYGQAMKQTPDKGHIILYERVPNAMVPSTVPLLFKFGPGKNVEWSRDYTKWFDGYNQVDLNDVVPFYTGTTHDGYVAVGSIRSSQHAGKDILVLRLKMDGTIIWANTYRPSQSADDFDDEATAVIQDAAGNITVFGTARGTSVSCGTASRLISDVFLMTVKPDGGLLFSSIVGDRGMPSLDPQSNKLVYRRFTARRFTQAGNGHYYCIGAVQTAYEAPAQDCFANYPSATVMFRFDPGCNPVWAKTITHPNSQQQILDYGDEGRDIIATSDNYLIAVGGFRAAPATPFNLSEGAYLIKTDLNGDCGPAFPGTWATEVSTAMNGSLCTGTEPFDEYGAAISTNLSGGFYVAGRVVNCGGTGTDMFVLNLLNGGAVTGVRHHSGGTTGWGVDVESFCSNYSVLGTVIPGGVATWPYFVEHSFSGDPGCASNRMIRQAPVIPHITSLDLHRYELVEDLEEVGSVSTPVNTNVLCAPDHSCDAGTQDYFHRRYFSSTALSTTQWAYDGFERSDGNLLTVGFATTGLGVTGAMIVKTNQAGSCINTGWIKTLTANNVEMEPHSATETPSTSPGHVMTGRTHRYGTGAGQRILFLKTDPDGNPQISKEFGKPTGSDFFYDIGRSIRNAHSSGYVLAATSQAVYSNDASYPAGYKLHLIRTDNNGAITPMAANMRWSYVYGSSTGEIFADRVIEEASDNTYIVAGSVVTAGQPDRLFLCKIDDSGNPVWSNVYSDNIVDSKYYCNEIVKTSDGGFLVVGRIDFSVSPTYGRAFVAKFSSQGDFEWNGIYYDDNDLLKQYHFEAVAETADGDFVIAGHTVSNSDDKGLILKITRCGSIIWAKTTPVSRDEFQYSSISVLADGGYLAVGHDYPSPNKDYWVTKAECDGQICDSENNPAIFYFQDLTTSAISLLRYEAPDERDIEEITVRTNDEMNLVCPIPNGISPTPGSGGQIE